MPEDGREPSPAELAHRIEDADRPSKPVEQRLRLQWNVPFGTSPYIPFWFAVTVIGLFVLGILWDVLVR